MVICLCRNVVKVRNLLPSADDWDLISGYAEFPSHADLASADLASADLVSAYSAYSGSVCCLQRSPGGGLWRNSACGLRAAVR